MKLIQFTHENIFEVYFKNKIDLFYKITQTKRVTLKKGIKWKTLKIF